MSDQEKIDALTEMLDDAWESLKLVRDNPGDSFSFDWSIERIEALLMNLRNEGKR